MTARIGVTGATGYIGRAVVGMLRRHGDLPVVIGRRSVGRMEHRMADLRQPVPAGLTSGLDAVIHLAAQTGQGDLVTAEAEVAFAQALFNDAAHEGCRIVFVSSQTASPEAPGDYGRVKHAIEGLALGHSGIVVRPGLVYGGAAAGLYGLLVRVVKLSPVIPDIRPRPIVNPVHVEDLAAVLVDASRLDGPATIPVAGPPISFGDFLAAIANHRLAIRRPRMAVPAALLRGGLVAAQPLLGPAFSPARLDSLLRLPPARATGALREPGIVLRTLQQGLIQGVPGRRQVLREGFLLARAVVGARPPASLLRRYARMLERAAVEPHPGLSGLHRWLVTGLDTPSSRSQAPAGSIAWRFDLATRLAECEPRLAGHFIALRGSVLHRVGSLLAFVNAAFLEACSLVARLVASRSPAVDLQERPWTR
jgi:nucleoside-diphosphate-sugar epimerase